MTAAELSAECDELMGRIHALAVEAMCCDLYGDVTKAAVAAKQATRKLAALLKAKAEAEEKR